MGHGTKRNAHPAAGHADQQPQGVVDLREGTQLSGSDCVPRKRDRLPVLHKQKVLAGFNDLATVEPRIAAEWHPTLNGALTPEMVTVGSTKKVWWECPLGHVWKAAIYPRTGAKKCGCPVCAGKHGAPLAYLKGRCPMKLTFEEFLWRRRGCVAKNTPALRALREENGRSG